MTMKQITDIEEIAGKTIESIYEPDGIVLIFTDKTYIAMEAYSDDPDGACILTGNSLNAYTLKVIGAISEAEYEKGLEERIAANKESVKKHDLKQLAKLQAKYPEQK